MALNSFNILQLCSYIFRACICYLAGLILLVQSHCVCVVMLASLETGRRAHRLAKESSPTTKQMRPLKTCLSALASVLGFDFASWFFFKELSVMNISVRFKDRHSATRCNEHTNHSFLLRHPLMPLLDQGTSQGYKLFWD